MAQNNTTYNYAQYRANALYASIGDMRGYTTEVSSTLPPELEALETSARSAVLAYANAALQFIQAAEQLPW